MPKIHLLLTAVALAACNSTSTRAPALADGAPAFPAELRAFDAESARRELTVGFYCSPTVFNSELTAPLDVFQHTIFHAPRVDPSHPGMRTFVVGRTLEPFRTFEGLTLTPDYDLAGAPHIDVLVVPSADTSMSSDLDDVELVHWLTERARAARYVLSYCDGAFPVAATGLFDGRAATTFPGDQDAFAARFPRLRLVRDVSFVDAGRLLTSAGGAKSYDSALYLVERLYGPQVARGVGRGLVIDYARGAYRYVVDTARTGQEPSASSPVR